MTPVFLTRMGKPNKASVLEPALLGLTTQNLIELQPIYHTMAW